MKTIGYILARYRKNRKLTQKQLCDKLKDCGFNIKNTALSSWENDVNHPNTEQFLALCKILGITNIYGEFIGPNPDDPMSRLDENGRNKALDYINLLIKSGEYQYENIIENTYNKIRSIRLYDIPVSAGLGEIIDDDSCFDEIEVGNEVPDSADFGIRVTGDSMEPQFVNGQIVWVHQTTKVDNGEIGIFYLDGKAYIKKLQDDLYGSFLVSLNKRYNPIEITNNSVFHIFGKVVS